jgi:hypothetical protein
MSYQLSSLDPAAPGGSFRTTTKVPFGPERFSFIASPMSIAAAATAWAMNGPLEKTGAMRISSSRVRLADARDMHGVSQGSPV